MQEIKITIDENGVVDLDLDGFKGKGCSDVTKEISKALGSVIKSTKKQEYFKTETKQKQKLSRF